MNKVMGWAKVFAAALFVTVVVSFVSCNAGKDDDAYILTKPGTVMASWSYKQLKMESCAWCGRTVNLNRHHIIPQSANPLLRDVRDNLIVLCRDCHFVLGHRCDWTRYNPDVLYICTHFTNCVYSSETRKSIEMDAISRDSEIAASTNIVIHTPDTIQEKQKEALERILKWNKLQESK